MPGKPVEIEHWSRIASEWTAWARAPNHDEFWAYRTSLLAFIGQGAGDALDVGCGEGAIKFRYSGLNAIDSEWWRCGRRETAARRC
jgi:hypothetical protein